MIAWSIMAALAVPEIGRVIVSTDCPDIARVAKEYGAQVPFMRPDSLSGDAASEWVAWQHALTQVQALDGILPDPFISVPATSPLRLPEDISACLNLFGQGRFDLVLAITDAHRNPWFNMVQQDDQKVVSLVNKEEVQPTRRQDAFEVFDITTVAYVANPNFVMRESGAFAGRVGGHKIPVERSVDIDTAYDFDIAEFLMKKRLSMA